MLPFPRLGSDRGLIEAYYRSSVSLGFLLSRSCHFRDHDGRGLIEAKRRVAVHPKLRLPHNVSAITLIAASSA